MKKLIATTSLLTAIFIFTNCSSTKKAAKAEPAKLTYETNITTLINANCTPCHIPSKGGNKKAYDNFASVKSDIDEIIKRIELHPGEKGFMPFKRARLSDSTINVFKQWKTDGSLE